MTEFWEAKFKEDKTSWGFEPSDSAMLVKDFFLTNHIKNILIPGIGYGRNARVFCDNGISVEGIEISISAIEMANAENGLDINIYHGSVTQMPYSEKCYEGIFCYALLHLLNKNERKSFIQNCFNQLNISGYMFFTIISKTSNMFGKGKLLSTNRYQLMKGLKVFFYDSDSIKNEFENFGLVDFIEIDEPIKHMQNEPPLKCILVKCRKM